MERIIDKYYGIREKGNSYEVKDFSKIKEEQETALYTYLLRSNCEFNVKYEWSVEEQSGSLKKKDDSSDYLVKLIFSDVIGELINSNDQKSSSFTLGDGELDNLELNLNYKDSDSKFPPKINFNDLDNNGTKTVEIKKGYYQGELLSYYKLVNKEIPKLDPNDFPAVEESYNLITFDYNVNDNSEIEETKENTVKDILQGLKDAESEEDKRKAFIDKVISKLKLSKDQSKTDFIVPVYITNKLGEEEKESSGSYYLCPIIIYLSSDITNTEDEANYDWAWLLDKDEVFKENKIDCTKIIFNKNFYSENEEKVLSQCIAKKEDNEVSGGGTTKIEIGWDKSSSELKEEIAVGAQSSITADVEDGAISSIEFNLYFLDKNGQYAVNSTDLEGETPTDDQALGYCIQAIKAKINTTPEIKGQRKIDKHYTKDINGNGDGGNTFDQLKDKIIEKLNNNNNITDETIKAIFTNNNWKEEQEVT